MNSHLQPEANHVLYRFMKSYTKLINRCSLLLLILANVFYSLKVYRTRILRRCAPSSKRQEPGLGIKMLQTDAKVECCL